mgnify:CR=1 FL=1
MLKTVKDACTPTDDALDYQASGEVESLSQILTSRDQGESFFDRSYTTQGMEELITAALARLSGRSAQAVFELSQSLGGGKTHLLGALGLTALYPQHRDDIVRREKRYRVDGDPATVVVFDGRTTPDHYMWGEIAAQISDEAYERFREFWEDTPKAPSKDDWVEIIGHNPILILLDDLPSYFGHIYNLESGGWDLLFVLTNALTNLFEATLEVDRCCVALSNLDESYAGEIPGIRTMVKDANQKLTRYSRKITPISVEGDEIYRIIAKRFFSDLPPEEEINEIAEAHAHQAEKAANDGYLTTRSFENIAEEVRKTYPFHPSYRYIAELFGQNTKYQMTHGVLQFTSRMIRSVWHRYDNNAYLIGFQHLNPHDPIVATELKSINPSLCAALKFEILEDQDSRADQINSMYRNDTGIQLCLMIFAASLYTSYRGRHLRGISRDELIEYLLAPDRDARDFSGALNALREKSWYLHESNERFSFEKGPSIVKQVHVAARSLPRAGGEKALSDRIEIKLKPESNASYKEVHFFRNLPPAGTPLGDILLVIKPNSNISIEMISSFLASLEEESRPLVLTGHFIAEKDDRLDAAIRWVVAIDHVARREISREDKDFSKKIETVRGDAQKELNDALQSTFDRLLLTHNGELQESVVSGGVNFSKIDGRQAEDQIEEIVKTDWLKKAGSKSLYNILLETDNQLISRRSE